VGFVSFVRREAGVFVIAGEGVVGGRRREACEELRPHFEQSRRRNGRLFQVVARLEALYQSVRCALIHPLQVQERR